MRNDRVTTIMVGIVLAITIVLLFLLVAMTVLVMTEDIKELIDTKQSGDSVAVALQAVNLPG